MCNQFTAIIERGDNYLPATCPEMPEATGQGQDRVEPLRDLADSIQSILGHRREEASGKLQSNAERIIVDVP